MTNPKTGDVLLVKGEGFISKLIRSLTGESFSHVALICVVNNSIIVREFVEGKGFVQWTLANWLKHRKNQSLYFGTVPAHVEWHKVLEASTQFPFSKEYGYLSLVKVWISQIFNLKIKTRRKVCSTYVQYCWSAGGFVFKETADPGDYLDLCDTVQKLD